MTDSQQIKKHLGSGRRVSGTDVSLALCAVLAFIIVCDLVQQVMEAGFVGSFTRFEATLLSPALLALGAAVWLRFRKPKSRSHLVLESGTETDGAQNPPDLRSGMLDFSLSCFAATALFWGVVELAEASGAANFDLIELIVFGRIVPPAATMGKVALSAAVSSTLLFIVWWRRRRRNSG